ncbi:hypothetical protein CEY05_12165 [Achromobacter sp. HZ34]|nr:hypothetical protein CEY05_12165 [Achromobacter sp. HZ34]
MARFAALADAAPTVPHSLTVAQGDAERYRQFDQALTERDHAEDMADKMAEAIGKHFGVDVGEHSNLHCPWKEALGVIAERAQGDELSGNSGELARQQGGSDAERQKALGEAVERACRELPADYEIQITLENGYGGAKLYQFDGGISTDLDDDDERDLAREISEGIATAIAQRAAAQGANDAS